MGLHLSVTWRDTPELARARSSTVREFASAPVTSSSIPQLVENLHPASTAALGRGKCEPGGYKWEMGEEIRPIPLGEEAHSVSGFAA